MSNSDKCSNKENDFSEEIDSKLDEILENQAERVQDSQESVNDSKFSEKESLDKTEYYIRTANAKILLDTLAPEVSKNEKRKPFIWTAPLPGNWSFSARVWQGWWNWHVL